MNGGKEGPNGAWLWKEVKKVKEELRQTPTIIVYVERPIQEDTYGDAVANVFGNHAYVATVAPPWSLGQHIGYGIRNPKAVKNDEPKLETYQPGETYKINLTYRNTDAGFFATDSEIALRIKNHLMSQDYLLGVYDCRGWAQEALHQAGLTMKYYQVPGHAGAPSMMAPVRAPAISDAEWAAKAK
jgi:hypothetical protein